MARKAKAEPNDKTTVVRSKATTRRRKDSAAGAKGPGVVQGRVTRVRRTSAGAGTVTASKPVKRAYNANDKERVGVRQAPKRSSRTVGSVQKTAVATPYEREMRRTEAVVAAVTITCVVLALWFIVRMSQ